MCGTRGLSSPLKPLMMPNNSTRRWFARVDSSRDRGIEGGGVAAGSENGNAFHG